MALADLIRPEVVKVPLVGKTKNEVIRELVQLLLDAGRITELESVYDALLTREALGSTGLEQGIAVPHAKTRAVQPAHRGHRHRPPGRGFPVRRRRALASCSSCCWPLPTSPGRTSRPWPRSPAWPRAPPSCAC